MFDYARLNQVDMILQVARIFSTLFSFFSQPS